jgi:hypothetical protein
VGVQVELRPLYTAKKERCVLIVSRRCSVRRLGLGVVWWSLLQSKYGRSVHKKGMNGFAAGVRCTQQVVLLYS